MEYKFYLVPHFIFDKYIQDHCGARPTVDGSEGFAAFFSHVMRELL